MLELLKVLSYSAIPNFKNDFPNPTIYASDIACVQCISVLDMYLYPNVFSATNALDTRSPLGTLICILDLKFSKSDWK